MLLHRSYMDKTWTNSMLTKTLTKNPLIENLIVLVCEGEKEMKKNHQKPNFFLWQKDSFEERFNLVKNYFIFIKTTKLKQHSVTQFSTK